MRDSDALKKLTLPRNLNFNEGMILVQTDGTVLQGESAFRVINDKTDISDLKDLFVVGINSKKYMSAWIYPIMFQLRKLVLFFKRVPAKLDRVDLE